MELLELPGIPSTLNDVIVELIPIGADGEFWTGKVGERVQIETIDQGIRRP